MNAVVIDWAATIGTIKPLHGVNNGPVTQQGLVDVSDYYREVGIPWVRIHDPNWPHPREVDIPQIFPDDNADPEDPASYDFTRTDDYLQSILDTGARIVYRLGVSIEHTKRKYYTHPPKDFERWARVCRGIVRHYNQGWANGFHHGITHWEIWNEPDIGDYMWTGSFEEYLRLYGVAARALKTFDPALQVGGFAAGYVKDGGKIPAFLGYCREHQLPLDFFSWHTYDAAPAVLGRNARMVRDLLDQHGFAATTSHLNEWNRHIGPWGRGREWERRTRCEMLKNEVGASYVASVLIGLQDAPVDVANYYDGAPSALLCGLFDVYGVPQKAFSAFRAFQTLLSHPERVRVTTPDPAPVDCLAAIDRVRGTAAVLVSNYGRPRGAQRLEFQNVPVGMAVRRMLILDRDRNLEPVRLDHVCPAPPVGIDMAEHTVALVLLS